MVTGARQRCAVQAVSTTGRQRIAVLWQQMAAQEMLLRLRLLLWILAHMRRHASAWMYKAVPVIMLYGIVGSVFSSP